MLNNEIIDFEIDIPIPPAEVADLTVNFPSNPISLLIMKLPSSWLVMTSLSRQGVFLLFINK